MLAKSHILLLKINLLEHVFNYSSVVSIPHRVRYVCVCVCVCVYVCVCVCVYIVYSKKENTLITLSTMEIHY